MSTRAEDASYLVNSAWLGVGRYLLEAVPEPPPPFGCGCSRCVATPGYGGCVRQGLAHRAVITLAPTLVGGLRPEYASPPCDAASGGSSGVDQTRLTAVQTFALGEDVVVSGAF